MEKGTFEKDRKIDQRGSLCRRRPCFGGLPARAQPQRGQHHGRQADAARPRPRAARRPPPDHRRHHVAVLREGGRRRRHDQQADLCPIRDCR